MSIALRLVQKAAGKHNATSVPKKQQRSVSLFSAGSHLQGCRSVRRSFGCRTMFPSLIIREVSKQNWEEAG